jgi:preprotein translocase subunit SecE
VSEQQPERPPRLLRMMGLVAASVAVTILVFFAIGYLLGRLLL